MSKTYVPLDVKEFVVAGFKVSESNSILYRRYKTVEGLNKGVLDAIYKGADYVSVRIIKNGPQKAKTTIETLGNL